MDGCASLIFNGSDFGTSFFIYSSTMQECMGNYKHPLAMKISIVSNLFCAVALTLSLASFTTDKKKNNEEKETAGAVVFDAALYKITDTNKVKLSVDKNAKDRLRVILKDKGGKIYYSEVFNQRDSKYRRVFDLAEMNDGTYVFELFNNKTKLIKEVQIQSTNEKLISLQ
jgi:hypothetical protein